MAAWFTCVVCSAAVFLPADAGCLAWLCELTGLTWISTYRHTGGKDTAAWFTTLGPQLAWIDLTLVV